ncbi:hypothetical protein D6827_00760, partial [Candidatus Parcubacteria bacterium]
ANSIEIGLLSGIFSLVNLSQIFWSKIISSEAQKILQKHAERHGVEFILNAKSVSFLGSGDFEGIKINEKEVKAPILAVGIGLESESVVLNGAGIEVRKGVVCDKFLQTSQPDIFAAGDCAEFEDVVLEKHMRYGNWTNAIMQGKTAALNMLGEKQEFRILSSYSTSLFGKDIVFIGDVERASADVVEQKVLDAENSVEIFKRDGRAVGAVIIGDTAKRTEITNKIKNREDF